MRQTTQGAIDCDVHVSVPSVGALLPYCDDYWADQFRMRGIDQLDFSLTAYPPNAPLSVLREGVGTPVHRTEVSLAQHGVADDESANALTGGGQIVVLAYAVRLQIAKRDAV